MKPGEQKLGDTRGRFLQVIKNGREIHDVDWTSGRILLSNRRLILAGTGGKRTIQLSKIQEFGGRYDVNQRIATVSDYFSVHIPSGVVLLAPVDYDEFETDFFGALLNTEQFLARHPAVAGGVVQNTEWEKSRLKVEDEAVSMATVGGKFVEVRLDDIGDVKTGERTIVDKHRSVIEVEHSDDEGTSLQTYISGSDRAVSFLYTLLREGEELSETSIELSETDKQVLTALYSGVSPFDIPSFLGLDVDEVEELFQRLIDHNVVEEIRVRHEVQLNARGRSIASDAINEQ
ncbi:chemotaxis protein CheF1 [Haloferax sp. Atlit-10N]|uniref:Taxis protein CheF n=1 Tax=Haloferax prahovense (strain DSM 18310 / JCM 13924 / TL6) TaxID=1227461 RepID=M0GHC0_HALPT|nr:MULTISPECIES: CheF family chemotaxis protein [Haloferax]ELZ71656.1 chemotaxis protein CheF1 [Haloferax prahovense DSM 18310]RDZ45770.1 chemotaxis protein CheF1 [Haloferax sp. Atlit-19N]RDZ46957.1 chemotaxis protein CheF1 [Haloferax sp. Atlit-16N]RDZ60789.1 chemotaxis protein CheF1 [Haloferax sp. Atlit-10N]